MVRAYTYLSKYLFSGLLGIYLRAELLGRVVILHLVFWKTAGLLSSPFSCASIAQHIQVNFCLGLQLEDAFNPNRLHMYLRAGTASYSSVRRRRASQGLHREGAPWNVWGIGLALEGLYTVLSWGKHGVCGKSLNTFEWWAKWKLGGGQRGEEEPTDSFGQRERNTM